MIALTLLGMLVGLVSVITLLRTQQAPPGQPGGISPTQTIQTIRTGSDAIRTTIAPALPKAANTAPTHAPQTGSGIDANAAVTKQSETEIRKLGPFLPYSSTLTLENKREITVHMGALSQQPHPWTLQIDVFGVDFNVPKNDPQYEVEKRAFLEGVTNAITWIRSKQADSARILVVWSDKKFSQDRAVEWLSSK